MSKELKWILRLACCTAAVVVAITVAPADAAAQLQDCGDCEPFTMNRHFFNSSGGGPKDCGSGHSDPDQCHVGSPAVEGSCDTHGACPQLPEPVAELRRMIEGLPGGQVRLTEAEETQIGDYARDFPEYVSINFERKAAQIKSCSDAAIVAHVPLSDHALRVLAANNA